MERDFRYAAQISFELSDGTADEVCRHSRNDLDICTYVMLAVEIGSNTAIRWLGRM